MSELVQQYDWRTEVIRNSTKDIRYSNTKDRSEVIDVFRKMIRNCDDYELRTNVPDDDKTLQKFLYARKFNLQECFDLYKNYHYYRKRNPAIFVNFNLEAEDIQEALENALPGVLKQKDRKGRTVFILTASNWDCSYSLISIYRALLFSLEFLIDNIHNQCNGFVVIVDWTEFTFRQSTYIKPAALRLMIEGLQDCFPARFKGIHFIGQPWYVGTAITLIKRLLNEKVQERIFVHGNNLSTLHEHVHKDILPAEMGGEEPSYNPKSFLEVLKNSKGG